MKNQSFEDKLKSVNSNISALEPYVKSSVKISFKCNICNNQWKATPNNILMGRGCPECHKISKFRNTNSVNNQLKKRPVKLIEKYVDSSTPVTFECETCKHQWKATPNNVISGRGCPHCKISLGEHLVEELLNSRKISYSTQQTFKGLKDKYHLRVDFFLPDYNTVIEVDGEQHRKSVPMFGGDDKLKSQIHRDQLKNQYFKDNGINLMRLEYERMKLKDFDKELDKIKLLID